MECPVVYSPQYITQNGIQSITFAQAGGNIKKEVKKHANALTLYYFDTLGIPYMKVLQDVGSFTDTLMMNSMRCEYKNEPDSRFYEPNIFCNEKGKIVANQTERSNYYYKYDSADRLHEWIEIDHEEDGESNVLLTAYKYDSIGRLDSILEKEGSLKYNLGIRQMDTIYRSTVSKVVKYAGERMSAVVIYTTNNRQRTIAASTYKYKYKGERLDQIELYIGDDKKPIYTIKVLKTETGSKD